MLPKITVNEECNLVFRFAFIFVNQELNVKPRVNGRNIREI